MFFSLVNLGRKKLYDHIIFNADNSKVMPFFSFLVCLWNVFINHSTKPSHVFFSCEYRAPFLLRRGGLHKKRSYQALNINLKFFQLLTIKLFRKKKKSFKYLNQRYTLSSDSKPILNHGWRGVPKEGARDAAFSRSKTTSRDSCWAALYRPTRPVFVQLQD